MDEELCIYDAGATFTADIEWFFKDDGTVLTDDKKWNKTVDKFYDVLEKDDLELYEFDDENFKIEHHKDDLYKVVVKDAVLATGVEVECYDLDDGNDKRWDAFWDKVGGIAYLNDIRDEEVSEVD